MPIVRRLKAYRRQIRKERPDVWMARLAAVRANLWERLNREMAQGTFSERDMRRFERHMGRLCKLNLPSMRADHQLIATFFYIPITLFPHMEPRYRAGRHTHSA